MSTLVVELKHFEDIYAQYNQNNQEQLRSINESIKMAGTFMTILPLLLMYAFLQKYFVESVIEPVLQVNNHWIYNPVCINKNYKIQNEEDVYENIKKL